MFHDKHKINCRPAPATLRDDAAGVHDVDVVPGRGQRPLLRDQGARLALPAAGYDRPRGEYPHHVVPSVHQPRQYSGNPLRVLEVFDL